MSQLRIAYYSVGSESVKRNSHHGHSIMQCEQHTRMLSS